MADPTLGYTLAQQGVNLAETPFNYRYPLTKLTSSDDYLKITILEYKAPGFTPDGNFGAFGLPTAGDPNNKVNEKGSIILPIPDDVKDSNSVTWGASDFNPLQAAAGGIVEGAYNSTSVEDATNKLRNAFGKVGDAAKTGSVQRYFQALGIGLASNVLLGGQKPIADTFSRFAGQIVNSNIELIFSSVNLREPFTFGFDIVPRSQKEAQQVKSIIRAFKKHSAAKKSIGSATGLFLKAPEVFKLEYMNGGKPHPYLNKFKICALRGMVVNYTPSGTYATYTDGAPINMTLGLTFQELTPIYAEDYDTEIGSQGTGY